MRKNQRGGRPPGGAGDRSRQASERANGSSSQAQAPDKTKKKFAVGDKMATAKSQMDNRRRTAQSDAEAEHLNMAPPELMDSLLEATLVIPGKHMLPRGIEESPGLVKIRKENKAYITRSQPNIFEIRTDNIKQLQNAMKELNWLIHDLRLSTENLRTRFVVQKPMNADNDSLVTVKLNSRPTTAMHSSLVPIVSSLAHDNFLQLRGILASSAYILKALGTGLKMRVNFGRFEIRQRKRGVGDEMTYPDFTNMVALYSKRGGAGIHTQLFDVANAEKVVQHLVDPDVGIFAADRHRIQKHCSMSLKVKNIELLSTVQEQSAQVTQLSAARMRERKMIPKLNWTVVSPDMQLDWNLQVDVFEPISEKTEKEFRNVINVMEGIKLLRRHGDDESPLQPPRVVVTPRPGSDEVDETVLKTSVILPFKSTRYVVEVSVSQTWNRMETQSDPETRWGVEFYGLHWEETLEGISPQGQRDDWGAVVRTLWPSGGGDAETGFLSFLEDVAEVQSALTALSLDSTMLRHV
ncbi:hypothetical protein XA68_13803 [Ophiocordyceps unilateralis]|uniref:DUF7905 domain-containing protein n=1 Tax=Ophiocordyceps unilateralis TaxID=268505 RepID=A0A2A9PVF7_OPHUN|nr:hypothetical protein XA68_13803 [Ophiocordyceps unilateralis]